MSELQQKIKQNKVFDKIFKENMQANLPGIIEHVLLLRITWSEELKDDVQHTQERKFKIWKYSIIVSANEFFNIEKDLVYIMKKDKGYFDGFMDGNHKKALDIALEMKKDGMPLDMIAKFTGLYPSEIESLEM
ncbi:hypothetical protein [Pedobacter nutrimenti]|jgi:hypothetical protein|uniref:Uncharacterized protein n=1 Tax=Pedobacter nutrimenti TaxID=1241337 RepID=A0A318UDG0_9SPHI|nr:hypothetical protein [Pedobacter nutrimenti]PYF74251.1 hypothetical protein B0O44_104422 [Pedobacter nutrimenti]